MDLGADLSIEALAEAMPGRALRTYPALLSTETEAMAWARAGAPAGAVVAAGYQTSPRGRAGWPWRVVPGRGLGFSLVLRPDLPSDREGWLYTIATSGLADIVGTGAVIEWPDEVRIRGARAAAVGIRASLGAREKSWAVVSVLLVEASAPRAVLLGRAVEAIEARYRAPAQAVLDEYLPRCVTIGRRVRARLIGGRGPQVSGLAVTAYQDGALVLEKEDGRRLAVRPQSLNLLEYDESPAAEAPDGRPSSG